MEKKITIEQVAQFPRPGMSAPKKVGFTPDGKRITYLFSGDGSLVLQLWAYDVESGKRTQITEADLGIQPGQVLSREEELRRERSRMREVGVTGYQYAGSVLLVPIGGKLYVQQGEDAPLTELEGCSGAIDPRLSPDGTMVAFVREGELQIADIKSGTVRTLTSGATEGITNGLAEYVAQEEMDRAEGYWWSADSKQIAYVRDDSRHIPKYAIVHQGKDELDIEEHRYPFAGKPNSVVQLGVVAVAGGETKWMNLGTDRDIYLARVEWQPNDTLAAQLLSRDQRSLKLDAFDQDGNPTTLTNQESQFWINLNHHTRFLKSGEILWSSENSGFCHLYLRDAVGELRALTSGDWLVTEVAALDEEKRVVYFHATRAGVTERHLYTISLDGGAIQQLTEGAGWHKTTVSPKFTHFVDDFSSLTTPPSLTLRQIDGKLVAPLYSDEAATSEKLGLRPPELSSFQTADGVTLHVGIYNPPQIEPGRRYPVIVSVYGGPHAQRVANQWDMTVDLRAQYLAQEGFVVLKVDNRGSANRGLEFEAALAWDMGNIEVKDQVAGVNWIAQRPYVDSTRVGVYGWSYGGYMSLMCLLRAADVFKVGVAGAPVTHWDGYDTCYTERYMGLPQSNPDGYARTTPMAYVANLTGKLLLVHGMVDENVHFRHTARLIDALAKAQKDYDLLLFPEERHMPREAKGLEYQERRVISYFQKHL